LGQPLLEIDNLTCGYDGGVVLEGLSLSLEAGEVLGVFGRNGVGKTTLLKTIMGLVPVISGNISLSGKSIANKEPYQIARQGVGYVPQGREIFGDFTVLENLQMGNLAATGFEEIFNLFPVLKERRNARAGSFSGGQQQQLAIGRALVAKPRLLLLDEPLEGLQPSIVSEIAHTLGLIAKRMNMAIVLVEQNIEMVLSLAPRCIFIEGGRVGEDVTGEELRKNPEIIDQFLSV
jgi:branched-chain amino acid transport system ATP-binding protein/urea transport system ATP-binding protein